MELVYIQQRGSGRLLLKCVIIWRAKMPEKNDEIIKDSKSKKKKSRKKKSLWKKLTTIIILLAILGVILYFAFQTLRPEKVIAQVNGEKITNRELEQKYDSLPEQYKLFITQDAFLDQIINVKLLLQEAKMQGVEATDEEVQSEVNLIKNSSGSDEAFQQLLEDRNMKISDLESQIREQLTINKLLNQTILSKIQVTSSEVRDYYNQDRDQFTAQEGEIRVRHILLATEDEAQEVLRELQEGTDFAELAESYSIDINSAAQGGELGFISQGQTVEEFENASFKLNVNQVSPIVQTQFGYHIIQREPDTIPYNEARDQIEQTLLMEKYNQAVDTYIQDLRDKSAITIEGVKLSEEIETFNETQDPICKENGKAIIRLYSTTTNPPSNWISDTFDELANEYKNEITAYHWQLDTGDNTLTAIKESGIPKEEVAVFQKYNPQSTVPTYVFGCKYVRIGNAYETLNEEKAEFKRVIGKLTG
jgi:foldase protein PrsA